MKDPSISNMLNRTERDKLILHTIRSRYLQPTVGSQSHDDIRVVIWELDRAERALTTANAEADKLRQILPTVEEVQIARQELQAAMIANVLNPQAIAWIHFANSLNERFAGLAALLATPAQGGDEVKK